MKRLKLIICEVELDKVSDFFRSQCAWEQLSNHIGFNGQLGGWTASENEGVLSNDGSIKTAIVLGFWKSKEHVDAFMSSTHDKIFNKSEQGLTYRHCSVNYYKQLESDEQKDIDYSGYKVAVVTHFTSLLTSKRTSSDITEKQFIDTMGFHVQYWQHCKNENEYIKIVFSLDADAFNQYESRYEFTPDLFKDSLAVSSQNLIELEDNWNVKPNR